MATLDILERTAAVAPWYTEDPFCAIEGVKTLESNVHHARLLQCEEDLRLHLTAQELPYTLTSDLLIRNVPLKEGVSPDIAIWPGKDLLEADVEYGSLELTETLRPALILEIASGSTYEADRDTKYDIYCLAGIAEYWLYDPMGHTGGPPFLGWQLAGTDYAPIAGQPGTVAGQDVILYDSLVLGTAWGLAEGTALRLLDPNKNDWYHMTPEALLQTEERAAQAQAQTQQAQAQAQQAEEWAAQARAQAQQAEEWAAQARAQTQQAEERAVQARAQTQQARAQAQRAEERAAQARAQAEEQSARDAAEIARLKALLKERGS